MGRIILAVIAGFLVWSIVWIAGDFLVMAVWADFAESMKTLQFTTSMLIVTLIRSIITSMISGFIAVLISKEFSKTTLALGVLLLLTGIVVQMGYWNIVPLWYNLLFWIFLMPATILGGKLKKQEPLVS